MNDSLTTKLNIENLNNQMTTSSKLPLFPLIPNEDENLSTINKTQTSEISQSSGIPNIPVIPGNTNTSNVPGVPGIPGVPTVPGVPGIPGVPGVPSVPGVPGVPGIPGIPGIPGMPMFPGHQNLIDPTKDLPHPPKEIITKKFQWSPIKSNLYKSSFWSKLQEKQEPSKAKEFVDYELLEKMFGEAKNQANKNKNNNIQAKPDAIKLLEDKRSMNIQITLSKVKFSQEKIKTLLQNYDQDNVFDLDTILTIISIYPNEEETTLLKNYNGEVSSLSPPEQFCHMLISIENCSKILKFLQFKKTLSVDVKDILIKIRILSEAVKSINNSEKFKVLLYTIRLVGNFLNYGTANGKALGFSITSLEKLDSIKSFNKDKSTLFDFVVLNIKTKQPELVTFYNEFNRLEEASQIDKVELDKQIKSIENGINLISTELGKTKNESYLVFLNNLEKYANVKLECVRISNKMLNDEINKLITTYGLNNAKFNLSIFLKSIFDFTVKFKQIYLKITRKETKALKKGKGKDKSNFEATKSIFENNNTSEGITQKPPPSNHVLVHTFKTKGEFNKIRDSVRKTVARRTALMKDLQDIKDFIKHEKSIKESEKKETNKTEKINNNDKIRITNFKASKMITEEDDDEKLIDEDFFMITPEPKAHKVNSSITNSGTSLLSGTNNGAKNYARGRTSKLLTRDEQKNLLKSLL